MIITSAANDAMSEFHDRMPLILPPVSFSAWLDPKTPAEALIPLLSPPSRAAVRIAYHAVGSAVGNVRNQGPDLIAPLPA
jgi:putative SOS response-associated peptidase YedK